MTSFKQSDSFILAGGGGGSYLKFVYYISYKEWLAPPTHATKEYLDFFKNLLDVPPFIEYSAYLFQGKSWWNIAYLEGTWETGKD